MSAKRSELKPLLVLHGGAGDISDERVPGKLEGLKKALRCALPLLHSTSSKTRALDAVEAAVRAMELDENFNAGYGAVLNLDGKVEVEAGIMEGEHLRAGCVTLLHDIMHPVSVARRVMEQSGHTFLGSESAQKFAVEQGFEQLPAGSLVTENARAALAEFKIMQSQGVNFAQMYSATPTKVKERPGEPGTVGAVAIDAEGNIAAATSTGGITGKLPGRLGDSTSLGSGTYADNRVGGVSATGYGEIIMRFNLAQRILSLIRHEGLTAQQATEAACNEMEERLLGTAGVITIDAQGELGLYWTSQRLAWAYERDEEIYFGIDHGVVFNEPL